MKRLIRNNYLELSLVKAVLVGIGYHDKELTVVVGPLVLEIKLWMFLPARKTKPSKYEVEL